MNAGALLAVLLIAKATVLGTRDIAWSAPAIVAYVWQDVAVALLFGATQRALSKGRTPACVSFVLYSTIAIYTALNVPVMVVLSTPLTWPMLRAARGTLADSMLVYVTWGNVLAVALTLVAAALMPRLLARVPRRLHRPALAAALLVVALGPAASARIDTIGLHRNVLVALVSSALPRIDAGVVAGDWTTPPFELHESANLSHLRGAATARNVVLVSLESTAAQYLRLYGGTHDVTPHLDALARNAVVFENAYAVYPESIKGLFAVLCSIYPAFDTTPEMYERAPCRSIASVLADTGYSTALFHSGRFAYLGMKSIVEARGYKTLEDAGDIGGRQESSFGVDEPSTVARALNWIDTRPPDRPFFLTYLPIAGHHPYDTPQPGPFPTHDEVGRYRNALRYADEAIGALMAGLQSRGLDKNTLWVVLGDHGEAFGQHQGNFGHTFFLYEENVRVPFLIAAPFILEGPQRSRTIVSLVDTAPTILDVLGIAAPAVYQGHSALDGRARMALFFTDYSLGLVGLRDGPWKFIFELESRRAKLFDLSRDPGETVDESTRQPSRAAAYQRTLRAWSASQKAHITSSVAR